MSWKYSTDCQGVSGGKQTKECPTEAGSRSAATHVPRERSPVEPSTLNARTLLWHCQRQASATSSLREDLGCLRPSGRVARPGMWPQEVTFARGHAETSRADD